MTNSLILPVSAKDALQICLKEALQYKYALEESCIIAITDRKGLINYANDNFCKISKYSREELIGQDHRIINSGFHSREFMRNLWLTIANGKIWRGEIRNKAKDGGIYWVDTTIVPFLNKEGKPYQYLAIRVDITLRKKLEEQQELFMSIVNSSDDGILSKNLDGIVTSWNAGAEKIFGYTSMEIIGKHISILIPGQLQNEEKEIMEKICKGEYVNHYETARTRKDGKVIYVSLTISPVKDSLGNIIGASKISQDISERKKAEEGLVLSEKKYRHLFANNPMPMWVIDLNTLKFLDVNEMAVQQYGYSRKEFISMTALDMRPEEDKEKFRRSADHSDLINSTDFNRGLWKHRKKDGTIIQVEIIAHEIIFEGIPARLILSNDITERKEAERELRKSEKRLKESQEIARLGNWELDFETNVSLWSEEACRIYGLTPEENKQTYEAWESFIHPEDLDYVRIAIKEAQRTLGGAKLNHRIILKDGAIKHILSQSRFKLDPNGKPIGIYGIAQDITEIKIAVENLRKIEADLNQAQAIASVGNWEIDLVNGTQVWSSEFYTIFGMKKEEETPSTELFLSFIHQDDIIYVREKLVESFKNLQDSSFDFKLIRKDGVRRYGHSEWKFEFNKNGNPIRLFGIVQDVTDRILSELERIKIVNDLMLRNMDLEQFAYIISHNFRAPVANIIGVSRKLNDPKLSTENKEILRKGLNESVTNLDNILKDLNHVLEVKETISETKEKVRFSSLVDDIKINFQNLIDDANIKIAHDFSEIDEILTLKNYLYSIFYNLITNSIKYRRQGVPCFIEIKSHLVKDTIELIFTDNGLGIDLQKRGGQVFGLYKRFHSNLGGKGMGLFMVKTLVETLGGKISIQSRVNEGTEFKIEFET